ncbi:hypothetical protein AB1E19_007397 [Capra hircus]
MRENWENDRAVTDFFKKVSMGDCRAWLRAFLARWEKMLKTSASLTMGASTVQPMAPASNHISWITTGVLTSFVIMGIIIASSPTTVLATVQPTGPTRNHITEVVLEFLAVFVIISIIAWILFKNRRRCSREAQQGLCPPEDSVSAWPPFFSCIHVKAKRPDLRNPKSVYQL